MRYIATDIDGVLTDGRLMLRDDGTETKIICYRDLDAVGMGRRRGVDFIFVTGESGRMVEQIAARFGVRLVYQGAGNKLEKIKEICEHFSISPDELVYIGDSEKDAPALAFLRRSYCPCDAAEAARHASSFVLETRGGGGVLYDVVKRECYFGDEEAV